MREFGDNQNDDKGKEDYDFSDLTNYLKKYYKPEEDQNQEVQNFDQFWDSLNKKIEDTEPINKIANKHKALNDKYQKREETLKKLLEEASNEKDTFQKAPFLTSSTKEQADLDLPFNKSEKEAYQKNLKQKSLSFILIILLIGLAAYASFRYVSVYNYIPIEEQEFDWKELDLSKDQVEKLKEIDSKWLKFSKSIEDDLDDVKKSLHKELAKTKPNLSLVDKYHREILDKEIILKREKANVFLEKRFVLNEEQTLKLLKSIQ